MIERDGNYKSYINRMSDLIPDNFYTLPLSEQDRCFHLSLSEFKNSENKSSVDLKKISIGDCQYDIFLPKDRKEHSPAIFYIHSGGFLLGSPLIARELCFDYAYYLNIPIVVPYYPVGVNSRYPETNRRVLQLFTTFQKDAGKFGVRGDKILFGGESCGGYFAAALSFEIRERGLVPFAAQLLINPVIDLTRWAFFIEGGGTDHLYREMMQFTAHYCDGRQIECDVGLNPLWQKDFSNLPPAIIWAAGLDPMRFEANEYHQKLTNSGTPSELIINPGHMHGSLRGMNEYEDCYAGFMKLVNAISKVI